MGKYFATLKKKFVYSFAFRSIDSYQLFEKFYREDLEKQGRWGVAVHEVHVSN